MSFLASLARPLWRLLDARNIDADAFFRQCGLDPSMAKDARGRLPYAKVCNAWTEATLLTGEPHIGLETGNYLTPLDLNALGVTFLSSSNLKVAVYRLKRYESILNSNLILTVEEDAEYLHLISTVRELPEDARGVVEDSRQSGLIKLARQGLNQSADAVEVAFTYPQPKELGEHFAMFRCNLLFNQPVPRITFRSADARRPFTDVNRELAVSNDHFLDALLSELNEPDLICQVKRAIIDALPSGTPSEEDVASQVFVSSRTLQRRLAEEGTSFRALLLDVRRNLAEKYISDQKMPLGEISYMLGFSDSSSFSRAFKRWTGDPPAVFRRKLAT